jgi:hypothetical protein
VKIGGWLQGAVVLAILSEKTRFWIKLRALSVRDEFLFFESLLLKLYDFHCLAFSREPAIVFGAIGIWIR